MPHHPAFNKIFTENLLSARFCAGGIDDEDDGDADADGDDGDDADGDHGDVDADGDDCS